MNNDFTTANVNIFISKLISFTNRFDNQHFALAIRAEALKLLTVWLTNATANNVEMVYTEKNELESSFLIWYLCDYFKPESKIWDSVKLLLPKREHYASAKANFASRNFL